MVHSVHELYIYMTVFWIEQLCNGLVTLVRNGQLVSIIAFAMAYKMKNLKMVLKKKLWIWGIRQRVLLGPIPINQKRETLWSSTSKFDVTTLYVVENIWFNSCYSH